MKTAERKKHSEAQSSCETKSTWGRSARVGLLSLLALWASTLSAQAQTKVEETKKDLMETVADTTVAWKSYKDIWLLEAKDQVTEKEATKESPTKFSLETGVGYTVGWKAYSCNRIVGVGKLFKDHLWETNVFTCYDADDPLHSKWSWKLVTSTKLYKGTTLEWDYTFTWTWENPVRVGLGYGGQYWDGSYKVVAYPYNSNGTPISTKVSFGTKVWKGWRLDSFVFVDFWKHSYYSETEYTQQIAKWIALFAEARLAGKVDGRFNGSDSQTLMWWLKLDIK